MENETGGVRPVGASAGSTGKVASVDPPVSSPVSSQASSSVSPTVSKAWARARAGVAQRVRRRSFPELDRPADPRGSARQHRHPVDQVALPARLGVVELSRPDPRPFQWRDAGYRSGRSGRQGVGARNRGAANRRGPEPGPARCRGARRRSRQHAQPAAGAALHLRQFRGRQAERTCLCRGPAGRRFGGYSLQPAVHPRRRRPRQDPSDARHGVADSRAHALAPGRLHLGREIHAPVRPGAALQRYAVVQGPVSARSTC